jgi:hypothetical protein
MVTNALLGKQQKSTGALPVFYADHGLKPCLVDLVFTHLTDRPLCRKYVEQRWRDGSVVLTLDLRSGRYAEGALNEAHLTDDVSLRYQRIWPLRMMFIASYPAMVFTAPSRDRNHWLATTRFLTKRWSCSMD